MSLTDTVEPAVGPVASGDVAMAESTLSVSETPTNHPPPFMEYQVVNNPGDLTPVSIITAVESGPEDTREAANFEQGGTGDGLNNSHPLLDEATAHVLTFSNTSVVDAFQSRREGAADMLFKASSTSGTEHKLSKQSLPLLL